MVVTPTFWHEVNLGGVENLSVIERSFTTHAMNECGAVLLFVPSSLITILEDLPKIDDYSRKLDMARVYPAIHPNLSAETHPM
jgi:hypothetical protein